MEYSTTFVAICAFVGRCVCRFLTEGAIKAYGVLLKTVVEDLETNYYLIGCAFSLQAAACNLVSPLARMISDWSRYNSICIIGGVLASIGYLCHAFLWGSLWQPFLYSAITGTGFGFCNVATIVFMKNAFGDSFTVAYPFSLLAAYFGVALLPLLSEHLLATVGLKIDMVVFGSLCALLVPVGVTILILDKGARDGYQSLGGGIDDSTPTASSKNRGEFSNQEGVDQRTRLTPGTPNDQSEKHIENKKELPTSENRHSHISRSSQGAVDHGIVTGHPKLLLVLFLHAVFGYNFSSWSIFLVPFGESVGMEPSKAVLMSTVGGIGGLLGNIYIAALFYRGAMNDVVGFMIPCFLVAVSFIAAVASDSFLGMAVFSFISGFGISAQGVVSMSAVPLVVCDRHFETSIVLLYFANGMTTLIGGSTTGVLVDITANYYVAFGVFSMFNFLVFIVTLVWWITFERGHKS